VGGLRAHGDFARSITDSTRRRQNALTNCRRTNIVGASGGSVFSQLDSSGDVDEFTPPGQLKSSASLLFSMETSDSHAQHHRYLLQSRLLLSCSYQAHHGRLSPTRQKSKSGRVGVSVGPVNGVPVSHTQELYIPMTSANLYLEPSERKNASCVRDGTQSGSSNSKLR